MADEEGKAQGAEDGLKAKNAELLAEIRALKAKVRAADGVTVEALTRVEQERDELAAQVTRLTGEVKAAKDAAAQAAKALETEREATTKATLDRELLAGLASVGATHAVHQKAAAALLRSGLSLVDGKPVLNGKPLAEALKEWAGGEEGKHFVAAPVNSGGGAPGGAPGGAASKTMTRDDFRRLTLSDPAAVAKFHREGGRVADA